jgi:AbrB family looped-hinge helix DNA binding protein
MRITVSRKGQIVIPADIRRRDDIRAGQRFKIERIARGDYRVKRCQRLPNEGLMQWSLSCPEKDFFVPITSESTATL